MKITSYGINAVNAYKNQVRNVKSSTNKASFADKIEISKTAQEMQGVSTYSTERAERVQQLKKDIASGEYKVDARKVAEDMLKYYRF
ncbi:MULTISPECIES: flagellar biosynthesis anti-sigma factor FlgM [Lysinibacillus]|uniref:Negative regulator of flagellin synthesis n=1 Tax=Lysinibacillus sphaericus TaxID=1421 RepID=A0A544UH75_LYSSH|nr:MULTISPECIES: flagellar biosynthesis anti-sigma factor FlgM [unclassified Lysinibacillus]MDD1504001.1 flagellar biosynthesis anti-sigma factor FlgM [Lysinibacillus sp. CNPSo 3705]TQR32192.1 flagellar biosynthesis anti-sigma factor FlgM [Lysinibacillus sp. SDF0037]UPW83752.1 flagellar biosynthesis anti-sigma factor FlgM [Lysinibacillus sp. Ag94]